MLKEGGSKSREDFSRGLHGKTGDTQSSGQFVNCPYERISVIGEIVGVDVHIDPRHRDIKYAGAPKNPSEFCAAKPTSL